MAGLALAFCLLSAQAGADDTGETADSGPDVAPSGGMTAAGPVARKVDCWFKPPADHVASCYRVLVPEDRVPEHRAPDQAVGDQAAGGETGSSETGGTAGRARQMDNSNHQRANAGAGSPNAMMLDLPVVVISTPKDRKQDDPVVYLSGGPGDGDWLDGDRIGYWWSYMADNPWLRHRDLILFDQRGVGLTEPRADCPELAALDVRQVTFGNDHVQLEEAERAAGRACLARLKREGHDAAAYTTSASAADLHDIFRALGLKRWNIYGLSYGTRLALTYMRDFPEDIRSAILDSVYPPQVRFLEDDAWRTDRAFRLIFDTCKQDRRCRRWYPDLAGRLERLIARLDASPAPMERTDPSTGKPLRFGFTGQMLLSHLFFNMYNRADIQRVPQIIDLFDRNLTKRMAREADDFLANLDDRPDWGDAMATTIDCLEDVAFNNLAKTQANYRGYPLLRGLAEDDPAPVCPVWVRPKPDPRLVQPITSTLPTLILGGVYDPVTPPQYARLAGTTLVNSFYIEFPGLGHDVLGNDNCAGRLADAFLNVPTRVPTDACLGELTLPEFEPPVD